MGRLQSTPRVQRGVALITVMIIVLLATTLVVAMTGRSQRALRLAGLREHTLQAREMSLAIENWSKALLLKDYDDNQFDHVDEAWAKPIKKLPLDQGLADLQLSDLSGKFNINWLVYKKNEAMSEADRARHKAYQDLFKSLMNKDQLPEALSGAIIDWVNPYGTDTQVGDADYAALTPPYQAAFRALSDISELKLIKGMTKKQYDKMMIWATALPVESQLNLNTAPDIILELLYGRLPTGSAPNKARDFESMSAFEQAMVGTELQFPALKTQLGVISHYFQLESIVEVGDGRVYSRSLLERKVHDTGAGGMATVRVNTLQRHYAWPIELPQEMQP